VKYQHVLWQLFTVFPFKLFTVVCQGSSFRKKIKIQMFSQIQACNKNTLTRKLIIMALLVWKSFVHYELKESNPWVFENAFFRFRYALFNIHNSFLSFLDKPFRIAIYYSWQWKEGKRIQYKIPSMSPDQFPEKNPQVRKPNIFCSVESRKWDSYSNVSKINLDTNPKSSNATYLR